MNGFFPVNAKSYYEFLPASENNCGDIWTGLPSLGLLGSNTVTGIVISPACDVTNFKTETLTFLPVIPVESYFATVGFLPTLRREIIERLKAADVDLSFQWPEPGYQPPPVSDIDREITRLEKETVVPTKQKNRGDLLLRAVSGLRIARACATSNVSSVSFTDLSSIYGPKWEEIKKQIITNSFRPDIHFLPKDDQNEAFPGIPKHAIALFRYPITVPSEIMSAAQILRSDQWQKYLEGNQSITRFSQHFSTEVPVKCLSLKSGFLSDLLARFTAVYSRIGSPDFSSSSVKKMAEEFTDG